MLKLKNYFGTKKLAPFKVKRRKVKLESSSPTAAGVKKEKVQSTIMVSKKISPGKVTVGRVKHTLWLIQDALPSNLVSSEFYVDFIKEIAPDFHTMNRQTEFREEKKIFGMLYVIVQDNLSLSAVYFDFKPFICLQADAWTSQKGVHVLGISISFFCVKLKKVVTVNLKAASIFNGKSALDISSFIETTLKEWNIEKAWILQTIGDAEVSLQNGFKHQFKPEKFQPREVYHSVCLAHEINTCVKHSFGLGQKTIRGIVFDFFQRWRGLVKFFLKSPKRKNALLRIQRTRKPEVVPVMLVPFCLTRWVGPYNALTRANPIG